MPKSMKKLVKGKGKRIKVQLPWGIRASMPLGRIPLKIGSDSHISSDAIYYPVVDLDAPMVENVISVAAGVVATTIPINFSLINNWATRFQALFDEYAICGARVEFRITIASTPASYGGAIVVSIDESNAAAPTSACLDQVHLDIPGTQMTTPTQYGFDWRAQDYGDLTYRPSGTSYTPFYVKIFAGASTNISATLTYQIVMSGALAFRFRGYQQT